MRRVHIVQLRLELESQLDLLLVILRVLLIVLLELHTHLLFVHHLSLELLTHFLLRIQVLLQHFFIVGLLL